MKRIFILLLALTLLSAGCGRREDTPVIPTEETLPMAQTTAPAEAPTEEPTEAPTETQAEYPETITTSLLLEGEPMDMVMDLFDGGSYIIYIPQDMWTLETGIVDGYLTDRWVCSFNDMIDFQVISFGQTSPEDAEAYIREIKNTYLFDDSNPDGLNGMDNQSHYFLNCEIQTDGTNTFAILTEFPMEAGDGFGGRTAKMFESFQIK